MKHITVTPAEEDEVVYAGAAAQPEDDGLAGSEPNGELVDVPDVAPEPQAKVVSAAAAADVPEIAAEPKPVSGQQPAKRPRADSYREATLEDLQSDGMPLMQKVIIVAAVVCIIGALVYYFAVMR